MRFLVDMQVSPLMVERLRRLGHDAVHAKDLPDGATRDDAEWVLFAVREGRIVISKDRDFADKFFRARPGFTFLHLRLRNMDDRAFGLVLDRQLSEAVRLLNYYRYVIVGEDGCIGLL